MTNNRLNIGIFTCHIDNEYTIEVCKGAECAAKELDCNLIVFPGMFLSASFHDPTNELYDYQYNSIFYYANPECLDALVVSVGAISAYLSEHDIHEFLAHFDGIPIITIEQKIAGYPCIKTDNASGIREAVEHLIHEHGRRHICFVAGREDNTDSTQRLAVYREVLAENNIPFEDRMLVRGDFSEYCRDEVARLIYDNPDMDAIVFGNDPMATGGYAELKKFGIIPGKDISVVGFDDSPTSVNMDPPLTTVKINSLELGYRAVKSAAALAHRESVESVVLPSHFVKRASCGCRMCTENDLPGIKDNLLEHGLDEIIKLLDDELFSEIKGSFYEADVLGAYNEIIKDIVAVTMDERLTVYPQRAILEKLRNVLSSDMTNQYPVAKAAYMLRRFASILASCNLSPVKRLQFNRLNVDITNSASLIMTGQLHELMRTNRMNGWSSIYITRDTLTYGSSVEKTYSSIIDKLKGLDYEGSYIYIYDDKIHMTDSGSWVVPKSIFLQAYYNQINSQVLLGESRRLPTTEIFDNEYTFYDKRVTAVIVPIFTNENHHGLFICNTDVAHFGSIYSTSLQLGASLKYMALLDEQNRTQEQLKMSLDEIHEKNELLNRLSTLDELTGIYNRRGFMDRVEYLINSPANKGRKAILLFADMDSLKTVNDRFGHKDGDFALRNIANILVRSFSPQDAIGRIGGDEFVCFAFEQDRAAIDNILNKIERYSKDLNDSCGKPYYIEMSVGVTEFICDGTQKIEDLLSQADGSLYTDKKAKRASIIKAETP